MLISQVLTFELYRDVPANSEWKYTVKVTVNKSGQHQISGSFDSAELTDISGYINFTLKDQRCAKLSQPRHAETCDLQCLPDCNSKVQGEGGSTSVLLVCSEGDNGIAIQWCIMIFLKPLCWKTLNYFLFYIFFMLTIDCNTNVF